MALHLMVLTSILTVAAVELLVSIRNIFCTCHSLFPHSGSCRDNPSCQCDKNVGPLPQGQYTLGDMFTYKGDSSLFLFIPYSYLFHIFSFVLYIGYPYSYNLYPSSANNMCGRSEFLIHGGNCNSGSYCQSLFVFCESCVVFVLSFEPVWLFFCVDFECIKYYRFYPFIQETLQSVAL
jgi:hypothetical protein